MRKSMLLLFLGITISCFSQLPETDIFLASIHFKGDSCIVSQPENFTKRAGYDNQPSFFDEDQILYTSHREGQTDIYSYSIKAATTRQLTQTPESEYSPVALGTDAFTVVQVEKDSAQRIWSFPMAGGAAKQLEVLSKVGYYCAIDGRTYAAFVLTTPFSLQIIDLKSGTASKIAENPGRCLKLVPHTSILTFVDKTDEKQWIIKTWDMRTNKVSVLVNTLPGVEDFVWTNNMKMLAVSGGKLFVFDPKKKSQAWEEKADLRINDTKEYQRIAISPDNKKIALVSKP